MTTRTERLDGLPFTRKHRRLLFGSGIGWALDAMDVGLISFVMAALAVHWSLTPTELSWIGSIGFVGMALGAAFGGLLADRIGRRQVFAATLLVYGLATGAAALSTGVAMLIVLRFIVGLGLGAELPVASTLVSAATEWIVRPADARVASRWARRIFSEVPRLHPMPTTSERGCRTTRGSSAAGNCEASRSVTRISATGEAASSVTLAGSGGIGHG